MGIVYLLESNSKYKIGKTTKNINNRISQLQVGCPEPIRLVAFYKTEKHSIIEKSLHRFFSHTNSIGEWFDLPINIVIDFKNICEKIENNINFLDQTSTLALN
jgi:hypothetical protein